MTDWSADFVGKKTSDFLTAESVGEALHRVITKRWKKNAAKLVERSWDLDPKTAANFIERGTVSERTLTKAATAERWALWHALGEELFGESYEDHLRGVENELQQAIARTRAHRSQIRSLEDRASRLVSLLDRPAA